MGIDQLIEAYTYARITGSSKSLDHLDIKAEEIIKNSKVKIETDVIFSNDEYEAKLRYIRNENNTHRKG